MAWRGRASRVVAKQGKVMIISDEKAKSIPEVGIDTRLLYDRIKLLKPGEVLEYKELSKIIGRDVRAKGRTNLNYARYMAQRDDMVVTCAVSKVGIKRLTDEENVSTVGESARARISKVARNAGRKLGCVNFDTLSNPQKIQHNAEMSHLGALKLFATNTTAKRIVSKVTDVKFGQLAIAETLEAFKD